MRQALYTDLDSAYHDKEMEWISTSKEAACFIALSDENGPMGLLELSLRNIVDGCIGGPVGYIEGIYLKPVFRGRGYGRRLLEFAADWFKDQGCRDMATDTEIANIKAGEFFRGRGFQETWQVIQFKKPLSD
jgi:aminoglycoside 6'-N-acetyltransferase I